MKDEEYILEIINKSARNFGVINLSSGNCGQFALALADKLINKGYKASIGILHKYDEEVGDLHDLASEEVDIYHVVVVVDDKIFDGTGKITTEDLIQFAIKEYRDDSPSYITAIDVDELALHTIIDFETNWNIKKEIFADFLSSCKIIKNSKFKID